MRAIIAASAFNTSPLLTLACPCLPVPILWPQNHLPLYLSRSIEKKTPRRRKEKEKEKKSFLCTNHPAHSVFSRL
ncbi:hypothetical protein BDDG_11917 [Blastomyces dermatitidis ATCC 18188]|uniref:Secreted protein n=1 Tax=Ajellomyces dermatitidis (strain ATCC 18188 / CBS 674.68) TaxID=653446 RepID=A0A0J9EPH7_AJEDA|nr:hypothetical protein BDDG_11917 [Blastomyces dermatitidis ATCC 18188]